MLLLTHFISMFHFYTENIRKTLVFWRFQGIYKWNTGLKWVKNKVNYAPFLIIPFDLVNQYLQHNLVYKRYNIFNISKCILFYFFFSVNTNYNRHYQGLKKDNHHSILDNDCCINRNFGKILCYVKYTIHLIKWNWTEAYFSLRKRCPFLFRIFRIWIEYGELLCKSPYFQSKCRKMRTTKIPDTDTLHAVFIAMASSFPSIILEIVEIQGNMGKKWIKIRACQRGYCKPCTHELQDITNYLLQ